MQHLAFLLVHYHTPRLLEQAVAALRRDLAQSSLAAEIIVVDNGNTPEGRRLIEPLATRYLNPGKNLGYAGGANLALAHTTADVLLLMNPDVQIFPGCIGALLQSLRDGAAAAGPRLYLDADKDLMLPPNERRTRRDELLRTLAPRNPFWARSAAQRWRRHARRYWQATRPLRCVELSGALLAFTRRALEAAGPFDEGYRFYFEESDWLHRLHRRALPIFYVPAAEGWHLYNQSAARTPDAQRWYEASANRFALRHYGATFMKRLRRFASPPRPTVDPPITPATAPPSVSLDVGNGHAPLWIELAEHARSFPAAATRIENHDPAPWTLPNAVWQNLATGTYTLSVVDQAGQVLHRVPFFRPANPQHTVDDLLSPAPLP